MSQVVQNKSKQWKALTYLMITNRTGIVEELNDLDVGTRNAVFVDAMEIFQHQALRAMPTELKFLIQNVQCYEQLFHHLMHILLGWERNRDVMVYGRTQTGKTSVKALLAVICQCCNNIPVVIVTTQCTEARELSTKLRQWTGGREDYVFCAAERSNQNDQAKLIDLAIKKSGILVVASTSSTQLTQTYTKLYQYLKKAPWTGARTFALILDECDVVYRPAGGGDMSKRIGRIRRLNPCACACMTATPFPTWLTMKKNCVFTNFCLQPNDQYVALEDMVLFQNEQGQPVFLPRDELEQGGIFSFQSTKGLHLTPSTPTAAVSNTTRSVVATGQLFANEKHLESPCCCDDHAKWSTSVQAGTMYHIPYCTATVIQFYKSALQQNQKGVLILDCMVPWVTVPDSSVFDKASLVQNLLAINIDPQPYPIAAIVSTGEGIYYRLPGYATGWKCTKHVLLGHVIEQIDTQLGLSLPIMVFAYRKLHRCVSARSSLRFPTHLCVYKGQSNSPEDLIQTIGRGTGNGRTVLATNGISHVTILTTQKDWEMARAGVALSDQVAQGIVSLQELLRNDSHPATISKAANEYLQSCRKRSTRK